MKKFKTISMGLVLTMGLMTGLGATQVFADDEKVYKIACDQAYAPFSIQQDDGSYKGIDVVPSLHAATFPLRSSKSEMESSSLFTTSAEPDS